MVRNCPSRMNVSLTRKSWTSGTAWAGCPLDIGDSLGPRDTNSMTSGDDWRVLGRDSRETAATPGDERDGRRSSPPDNVSQPQPQPAAQARHANRRTVESGDGEERTQGPRAWLGVWRPVVWDTIRLLPRHHPMVAEPRHGPIIDEILSDYRRDTVRLSTRRRSIVAKVPSYCRRYIFEPLLRHHRIVTEPPFYSKLSPRHLPVVAETPSDFHRDTVQ